MSGTEQMKWEDLVAMLKDSIEGFDEESLIALAQSTVGGFWEYDFANDVFTWTLPTTEDGS